MKDQRLCIYPKDVSIILGKSVPQARRILSMLKTVHGKEEHQYISITEFATYFGLPEEEVRKVCR